MLLFGLVLQAIPYWVALCDLPCAKKCNLDEENYYLDNMLRIWHTIARLYHFERKTPGFSRGDISESF